MTAATAHLVLDARARLGEGPVWDEADQCLYWVDILGFRLHRHQPISGEDHVLQLGAPVCAVAPRRGGGLVLALEHGFALLDDIGSAPRPLARVTQDGAAWRFNDGGCDPAGRFWAGTMTYQSVPGAGTLYRLDADGGVAAMVRGATISNGLAWSADGGTMYYVDTATQGVDAFAFDVAVGTLGNRRRIVSVPETTGSPDGMTVDATGCLWVAIWGGGAVHRYTPDGRLDQVVHLPVSQVTSCAFGGGDLRTLFITTAREGLGPDALAREPGAGALFACDPGVGGMSTLRYAG